MIPNQWYAILESREVQPGQIVGVKRMGIHLAAWRDSEGQIVLMRDKCPHRGAALSLGKIVENHVQCPFHGFEYDPLGTCKVIPANGKNAPVPKAFRAHSFPAREAHGLIWLWWGHPQVDLPPVPFFDDLDDSFAYATYAAQWNTHYSRAIENQLDVSHLPFIHAKTIGRGNRTVVNGPVSTLEDDELRLWVTNEIEAGQIAIKPGDAPVPDRPPMLRFRFPNIWENVISPDLRVFVAFAPIDDENTLLYLRFYQRFIRIPLLRELVCRIGALANNRIASEDQRVVVTQQPKRAGLGIGEKLIPADQPIIRYLTRRKQLIEAAGNDWQVPG
ncbi:MAG: aromatic ring-hydroxylating dioxygenase subunit alpha [Anaerolineae bacterium]|nr:aromatic ring-hydroxylating dioxygenase subunit alpha [Anaerolineae bacterium]